MTDAKNTYYKYCIVPKCSNTTTNSPSKLFFSVPKNPIVRKNWTNAMKRDDKLNPKLSCKTSHWCCEDHFSLEEDMENYWQWMLTKNVKRLQLKTGVVPHLFKCQKNDKSITERPGAMKRKRLSLIQECLSETLASDSSPQDESLSEDQVESTYSILGQGSCQLDKSTQANIRKPFRSKGTSTDLHTTTVACSPLKNILNENFFQEKLLHTNSGQNEVYCIEMCASEGSENNYEFNDDSCSEDDIFKEEEYKKHMKVGTVMSIEKDPKLFLGLPPKSFFLIQLLTEQTPMPVNHIYIVLKKLRLNMPFSIMALDFGLSISTVSRVFSKSLPILANVMQELIVWPKKLQIQACLPTAFRARYAKVTSIIDCLEIEIEQPSNPLHQALTWSNYYNCNTIKYLVSCTPDGVITYVSEGYGGRASDLAIVEDCGYLNKLSPGALVMADRGFKNISVLIEQRGCSLIRPPSVSASKVSSKQEVKQSKIIAALRIHVERVIGRLREFSMLSPHACVDNHFVSLLDYAMIISCGIINMHDHLIKK